MSKALVKQEKSDLAEVLEKKGMTHDVIADKLIELLDWEDEYVDKNGNCHMRRDGNLRLKAIELWLKLQGSQKAPNNHLHVTEGVLDRLLTKDTKNKRKGSK